jgi:hypothetical protein
MDSCSSITYNPTNKVWVVVGDASQNYNNVVAYTTFIDGSGGWTRSTSSNFDSTYSKLNGIIWTGSVWLASCGAGSGLLASTSVATGSSSWNNTIANLQINNVLTTPSKFTNAVAFTKISMSLLTTGMISNTGVGAGVGALFRANTGRTQGLMGNESSSVIVRSTNGSDATTWSPTFSKNFLICVGGGIIRDSSNNGGYNRMSYSYDGGVTWTPCVSLALSGFNNNSFGFYGNIRTVKYSNGIWVAGGDTNALYGNTLAYSRDGVNWIGSGGSQIFGTTGSCYAVCCNNSGRWVAVGGRNGENAAAGSNYTMAWSDDGINWTPIIGSRALFTIVCQGVSYGADASGVGMWTAIGRGVLQTSTSTGIAYSYDGKNWFLSQTSPALFVTSTNLPSERYTMAAQYWKCVAISSSGQYQSALNGSNGLIYTSSDYGVSWTARLQFISGDWRGISISETGQYQTAVSYSGNSSAFSVSAGTYIHTSSDYGVTWIQRKQYSYNWTGISISSTGQYQSACNVNNYVYTSSDYGVFWTPRTFASGDWRSISVSSSGKYQSVCMYNNYVYTSYDYGVNWTSRSFSSNGWQCISVSGNGKYQTVVGNGVSPWYSLNYGVDWYSAGQSGWNWTTVALAASGRFQIATNTSWNQLWFSNNYGQSWSYMDSGAVFSVCYSIGISSSGQYIIILVEHFRTCNMILDH